MALPYFFDPLDWYWIASDGRIYSSGRNTLVHQYDAAYLAFLATKGGVTPWPTDAAGKQTTAALQAVMSLYSSSIILTF